ncbi:hypothetical protein PBY51_009333 [Eleginops maclovinus]|uniref:Uncharacterized protein n=1 Tax=Eleginops maclovinus TaxID=56733 RepID=A0AAN7XQU6_ELEMC|nr:hypothetical protein PBY51_009333 [Eleginops maclovinus]
MNICVPAKGDTTVYRGGGGPVSTVLRSHQFDSRRSPECCRLDRQQSTGHQPRHAKGTWALIVFGATMRSNDEERRFL